MIVGLSLVVADSVVIFLHTLGLVLMRGNHPKQVFNINQIFLIQYLSCTEIMLSAIYIFTYFIRHYDVDKVELFIAEVISSGLFLYIFIMDMILLDRFALCYLNTHYSRYFQTCYLKVAALLIFLLSLTPLPIKIYALQKRSSWKCDFSEMVSYTMIVLLVMYTIEAAIVYTYIINTLRRKSKKLGVISRRVADHRKRLVVPLLIVSTFMIFLVLPELLFFFFQYTSRTLITLNKFVYRIGYISDAIIFVFLIPSNKRKLSTFLRKGILLSHVHESESKRKSEISILAESQY